MVKTVLVTGVAGYLASSLVDILLNKGYRVIGLDNNFKNTADTLIPYITNDRFTYINADITNKRSLKGVWDEVDLAVHAAAIVGAPACRKYEALSKLVNVNGTWNILEDKPDEVPLVYCNTGSIYKGGVGVCDENSSVDPQSHYAKTKYNAENIVLESENTISHRYATAAGVSRNNMRVNLLANDLTIRAINEKVLTLFEADFMRTFIHCRDIASAIVFTLEHFEEMLAKQRVYNVGSDSQNYTKRQLAEMIRSKTGCAVNYVETEKDPDQRDYGYNQDAIMSFGWHPAISMDQTLDELIKVVPLLSSFERYK